MWKRILISVVFLAALTAVHGQLCPANWYGYSKEPGSKCYRFNGEVTSWQDARTFCQVHGGDILKLDTVRERNWMFNELVKMTNHSRNHAVGTWWLGLKDSETPGQWSWADGSAVTTGVLAWATGAQRNNNAKRCGTIVQNSRFNVDTCTTKHPVICARDRGDAPSIIRIDILNQEALYRGKCDQWCPRSDGIPLQCDADRGWQTANGQCYKPYNSRKNWISAKHQCNHDGASLVTIDTPADQTLVHNYAVNNHNQFWIGLSTLQTGNQATWMWTNGTTVSTTYWHGTPRVDRAHLNSTCAAVSNTFPSAQSWITSLCNARRPFVCRKPEGVCQPGWVGHRSMCYEFNAQYRLSFRAATQYCQSQRAELLRIQSDSTQYFIVSYLDEMKDSGAPSFWTGASDNGVNNGPFKWRNGQNVTYKHWAGNRQPTNTRGKTDCSFISTNDRSGSWRMTSDCTQNKAFVCIIPMGRSVHTIARTPPPHFGCPAGWRRRQGTCFKVGDQKVDWSSGQYYCNNLQPGANLAVISSSQDMSFVGGLLKHGISYWIGLNDRTAEQTYQWNDATSPVSYTNWSPGQPNNHGTGQNCVIVLNGRWNDWICSARWFPVCSKVANSIFPSTPPTTPAVDWTVKCGLGWESNPSTSSCYIFADTPLSWLDALNQCQQYNGTLVSIETVQEQAYLAGRVKSMSSLAVWTGANDRHTEGGWQWASGAPFAFLHWGPGQPGQHGQGTDCVSMLAQTSKWDDVNCNSRNGYICEKSGNVRPTRAPRTTVQHVPAGMVLGCPPNWLPFQNSCYLVRSDRKNWADAQTACGRSGAQLASILNRGEQNFIQGNLPPAHNTYEGLWLGLNDRTLESTFVWADGSAVAYTNWNVGEPNSWMNHNEDCVDMTLKNGKWNDEDCNKVAPGYVCKAPKRPVSATQSPYQKGCPPYSQGAGPYCYRIYQDAGGKSWNAANTLCQQRVKGTLASINNRYLSAFMSSQLVYRHGYFWIGLSDRTKVGTLRWIRGDTIHYTNWFRTHTGNENHTCVAMRTGVPVGMWENRPCNQANNFICQFSRQGYTLPPTTQTPWPNVRCPSGWTTYKGYCYHAFANGQTKKTWSDAVSYCQRLGGDLPSFHNNNNDSFVINMIQKYAGKDFWIGLNDRGTEGTYAWSDGSPVEYTHWGSSEPNDFKQQEDCVALSNNVWVDMSCAISKRFICALPRGTNLTGLTTPSIPVTSPQCGSDPNWYFYQGFCYQLNPKSGRNATLSWYDAGSYCTSLSAALVSIHSQSEDEFILSLISKRNFREYWTGFNEFSLNGYVWQDGTPSDYVNWFPNEPNDYYGAERCVTIRGDTGWWNDQQCSTKMGYVCKKPVGSAAIIPTPTPYPAGGCSSGFTRVPGGRNKCFYIGGAPTKLNFTAARDMCRRFGNNYKYDIASIEDLYEQAFVLKMAATLKSNIWIGLNDRLSNNKFVWQNNAPVMFTNWDKGEPTSNNGQAKQQSRVQNCVAIRMWRGHEGRWADVDCSQKFYYLCQSRQDPVLPIFAPPGSCPKGYTPYKQNCYKLSKNVKSWPDALTACQNDTGSLVSINDIYEQAQVITVAGNTHPYWIGLSDARINGLYGWSDNRPVMYTNWGYKEPSYDQGQGQLGGHQGCVMGNFKGKWNDTDCTRKLRYICKISNGPPPVSTVPTVGSCSDPTWIPNGDSCYLASVNTGRSWPEANFACQQRKMQLASIHSKAEMDFVYNLAKQAKVTNQQYKPNIWLGMSKGIEGSYSWTDQSPVNFLFWSQGEPTNIGTHGEMQQCIEFDRQLETWNDVSCFTNRGYVCKAPKVSSQTGGGQSQTSGGQPQTGGGQPQTGGGQPVQPLTYPNGQPVTYPNGQRVTYGPSYLQASVPTKVDSDTLGLSSGGIAGVVVAAVLILVLVAVGLIILKRRGTIKPPSLDTSKGFDNSLYYNKDDQSVKIDSDA